VLGILPGVIGAIQATETIKILIGKGTSLSGRLLLYDALEMSFREVRLGKDPDAPAIEKLIDYDQFCGVPSKKEFTPLTAGEVMTRRAEGWAPFVLDVRRAEEAAERSLPFTDARITHKEIGEHLEEVAAVEEEHVNRRAAASCVDISAPTDRRWPPHFDEDRNVVSVVVGGRKIQVSILIEIDSNEGAGAIPRAEVPR